MKSSLRYSHRLLSGFVATLIAAGGLVAGTAASAQAAPPPPSGHRDHGPAVVPDPFVERIGGADRYAVSAAVSAHSFEPGVPVAYVASGEVFSDALSASAAAGAEGGVVLLTQPDAIPTPVATELRRLKPQRIVVLGGTATIAPEVETALRAFSGRVDRIGGADRFAVSAKVSASVFGSHRPVAYVASGTAYPDALSASAAAGRLGGPVLLVRPDAIPVLVADELRRLAPAKIVVLGGLSSVADSVISELRTMGTTTRIDGADRYAVSAAVSAGAFPPGVPTVYVASGTAFADALSGGAAAIANAGPMLLVTTDSIPTAVGVELDRLRPRRIVVLGGTASVSDATLEKLRAYLR
ncbi:cell wall-binding repeat-containing protein [Herbiconiux ginsengi]|uniref:Putative cell wall binding repeat 2 n=1 Tax=Herbiconiux ginsengi TaxID=381665 RepID=A0A1H3LXG1_9MICO|nr:cell wall-binding repeat-containing protein [Herbiconiux ginsengi]SDY69036.1 Putative cell wall binding repeat 2 [Herbiconiux ginsengi]